MVTRKRKPEPELVSMERDQQREESSRTRLLEMFMALPATSDMTEDEAMRLADEAKHSTRPTPKSRR